MIEGTQNLKLEEERMKDDKNEVENLNSTEKELRIMEKRKNQYGLADSVQHINFQVKDTSKGGELPICRICLSDENETLNPLFSPCKCAGTMQYIHLNCLQEWLNSKLITKETPYTKTFFWKNLECELCKSPFPN